MDPRRFGRVWCLRGLDPKAPDATMEAAGLTPLGPEALDLDPKTFAPLLQTERPIKSLLLDQSRIAGLGNIYADESLWAACIHPARAGSSLTSAEAAALLREIQKVLRRAIRAGGTTFSDFRNVYGDMGRFRNRLKVYGRQGEPCPRCGTTIQYLRASGRGTHICPRCQVVRRRRSAGAMVRCVATFRPRERHAYASVSMAPTTVRDPAIPTWHRLRYAPTYPSCWKGSR